MKINLKRVRILLSANNWDNGLPGCTHGPKRWPRWRLFSLSLIRLDTYPPSTGYRLWVYTKSRTPGGGNVGRTIDLYFDRRKRVA